MKQPEHRRLLASAIRRVRAGDLVGALLPLDRLATMVDSGRVFAIRGHVRNKLGQWQGAIADFTAALRHRPRSASLLAARADVFDTVGALSSAANDLDRAVELAPRDGGILNNRASVRYRVGDMVGARADYDQAIAVAPTMPTSWSNRGLLRLREGDLIGARADFDRAIELDPAFVEALLKRGGVRGEDDPDGARDDYWAALQIGTRDHAAWTGLARCSVLAGAFRRALEECSAALFAGPPTACLWFYRARALAGLGDTAGAVSDFTRALELEPDNETMRGWFAAVLFDLEDYVGCRRQVEWLLSEDPEHAQALWLRARLP